jgi:hypothetical protein
MNTLIANVKGQVTLSRDLLKHLGVCSPVMVSPWTSFLTAGLD